MSQIQTRLEELSKTGIPYTLLWFLKAVPTPKSKNLHTQLGCHFEEVAELIEELDGLDGATVKLLADAEKAVRYLAEHLKKTDGTVQIGHHTRALDALMDQIVTATGVCHMAGYDPIGGLNEVNRSNWSKFVGGEPQFDENFKVTKGPDYTKPILSPFALGNQAL